MRLTRRHRLVLERREKHSPTVVAQHAERNAVVETPLQVHENLAVQNTRPPRAGLRNLARCATLCA
jgi:precorrin-6B methylase 1